jgi:hypothetical protein
MRNRYPLTVAPGKAEVAPDVRIDFACSASKTCVQSSSVSPKTNGEETMRSIMKKWFGIFLSAFAIASLPAVATAAMSKGAATGGGVLLELDGVVAGPLRSSEGGAVSAAVISQNATGAVAQQKRLGQLKYDNITLAFGAGMDKSVFEWMQGTLSGQRSSKSGAVVYVDQNYREVQRLVFTNATIAEIGFPALTAAEGKTAFLFTLTLSPQTTRFEQGSQGPASATAAAKTKITVSNFRLSLPGVDTQYVTRIEPIVVKAPVAATQVGSDRFKTSSAGQLEISSVVIEMSESHADDLWNWASDFIVQGQCSPQYEKSATLDILDQTMKDTVISISLNGLGIHKVEPPPEPTAGNPGVVRASMYCQGIQFSINVK